MTTTELDLTADVIDVRDIIARVEELESKLEEGHEQETEEGATNLDFEEWVLAVRADASAAHCHELHDEAEELATLTAILDDLKSNGGDEKWRGDWYPVTLIRESYFEEAMDELVADCYEVPKNLPSFMTITLDYVALQMDYTSTEIDGVTYLYR
jgi:hypothetical protein